MSKAIEASVTAYIMTTKSSKRPFKSEKVKLRRLY